MTLAAYLCQRWQFRTSEDDGSREGTIYISKTRLAAILICTYLILSPPAFGASGELFVLGGIETGSYGTDGDTELQKTGLTYVTGDKYQLRIDASMIRVMSESSVAPAPIGPIPSKPGPQGPGNGQGGQQGSPDGGGPATAGGSIETASVDPDVPTAVNREWVSGPGDLRVSGSMRVLGGGAKVFRMDTGLQIKIPTADEEDGLGTGEMDVRLGISGEYRFWTATAYGGIGWNWLGDPAWVELNDVPDLYAGVESEPLRDRIILSGWLEGNPEVVDGAGSKAAAGIGLRTVGKIRWRILGTAGLTDAASDYSVFVACSFGIQTAAAGTRGAAR